MGNKLYSLLLSFLFFQSYGQSGHFVMEEFMFSANINLDSNGRFIWNEYGCLFHEYGRGTYRIEGDIIQFSHDSIEFFGSRYNIEKTTVESDSIQVDFEVYDYWSNQKIDSIEIFISKDFGESNPLVFYDKQEKVHYQKFGMPTSPFFITISSRGYTSTGFIEIDSFADYHCKVYLEKGMAGKDYGTKEGIQNYKINWDGNKSFILEDVVNKYEMKFIKK